MEIYFKTDKSIIKMKDRIDIEGEYITTSSIDQKEKAILKKFKDKDEAEEKFKILIEIMIHAMNKDKKNIIINL